MAADARQINGWALRALKPRQTKPMLILYKSLWNSLWNTFPSDVKKGASFKVFLGKWMERFPDRPPVTGYTRQNNNSIPRSTGTR